MDWGNVRISAADWAADRQRKEQVWDAQWNQLQGNIGSLQAKLPALLTKDKNGNPVQTPEYLETMNSLTQAIQARNEFLHPAKNPGALQKFAHLLHLTKGPQAQSTPVQPAPIQVPAQTGPPISSEEQPAYRQYGISAPAQPGPTQGAPGTRPAPLPSSQTMAIAKPKGLVEPGNLPIWNRPVVQNADGTHSSEYSTSFRDEQGREVLVPTVVNGKFLTPDGKKPQPGSPEEQAMKKRAWQHYLDTGENLGKFDNAANANAYANVLHNRKAQKQSPEQLKAQALANTMGTQPPRLTSTIEPGLPATNLPGMETPAGAALPAGPATTVKGPPQTPGQLKARAEANRKAQAEAGQMAAAAPLQENEITAYRKKLIEGGISPEDAEKGVRIHFGLEPKEMPEKYFTQLQTTTDAQGKQHYWRVPMDPEKQPEEVDFNGQLIAPKTGKPSNVETERESYRLSHGIPSGQQLTLAQEKDFLNQMWQAHNPYGQMRAGMAREALDLRESESAFKDFLAVQKQLTPLERVIDTSSQADSYVQNPNGPGDVKLTLAFFDAIKTTGVRFTQQEQNFIIGSRGFMDGVQAKFDAGWMGTVFSPDQRAIVAGIIKKAGAFAEQQKGILTGGAAKFRPKVAEALTPDGGAGGAPSAQTGGGSKGSRSLAAAMALPINKGKTEAEVEQHLQSLGYTVTRP